MKLDLTLTDVTRMHDERICIAGVDADGRCIRPVVDGSNLWEDFLTSIRGCAIRAFSVVRLEMGEARPDPPHTEDWVFNPFATRYVKQLSRSEALALLRSVSDPDVASIFGAPITTDLGSYLHRGEGVRSLGTVRARRVVADRLDMKPDGRARLRLRFCDAASAEYTLSVTDLAFMRWTEGVLERSGDVPSAIAAVDRTLDVPEVHLRIGLSRNWEKHPDRCYLQITGVYPSREADLRG